MTRVAIVGGGVSGIGAAKRLLEAGVKVIIIEAADALGGNCFGVDVRDVYGNIHRVDAGVTDFNRATFHEVHALVTELGLECQAIRQDASFVSPNRDTVWSVKDGHVRLSPHIQSHERFLADAARFKQDAHLVLNDPNFADATARDYLDANGYGEDYRRFAFGPRAAGCFAMPDCDPELYPIRSLVTFWRIHGIVGPHPADRLTVVGGMHRYVSRLHDWLLSKGATVQTSSRVVGINRRRGRIEVRAVTRDDDHVSFKVDHVILSNNANEVVPLLEDATSDEKRVFLDFPYQRARLVIHQDSDLMAGDREQWGAFNYVVHDLQAQVQRPTITFHPNVMARLPADVPPVFVSMNPDIEPDPALVLEERYFVHPIAGLTQKLAVRVDPLQGQQRTWFCGSYLLEPWVHEPALLTGQRVAERLLQFENDSTQQPPGMVRPAPSTRAEAGESVFLLETRHSNDLSAVAVVEQADSTELLLRTATMRVGQLAFVRGAVLHWGRVSAEGQTLHVFRGTVSRFDEDSRLMRLEHVAEVEQRARRRAIRAQVKLNCQLTLQMPGAAPKHYAASTVDISASGLRLRFAEPLGCEHLAVNARHEVRVFLPERSQPLVVSAQVVRLEQTSIAGSPVVVAAAFDIIRIDEADRAMMEVVILRLSSRQFTRVDVSVPCQVHWNGLLDVQSGWILNLSGGGATIAFASNSLDSATPTLDGLLTFQLPDHGNLRAPFTVVRIDKTGDGKLPQASVRFTLIDDDDRRRIVAFVLFLRRFSRPST